MKKITFILSTLLCLFTFAFSEIIAGVAIRVNGRSITLNEIAQTQKTLKTSKQTAIDHLINERLKDDEIERFKINIDEFKIDEEIALIAANANLSKEKLLSEVSKEGLSLQEYRSKIKKQLQTRELMQRIISSNISISNEDELLAYYTKHKKEFAIPSQVNVVRYSSTSDSLLQQAIQSPKQNIKGVQKSSESIAIASLTPQVAQVFINTPNHTFTPVLTTGSNNLVSFYIKNRSGEKVMSYEEAKPIINQKIMARKEQSIITEHFNKLRSSADIITLRE